MRNFKVVIILSCCFVMMLLSVKAVETVNLDKNEIEFPEIQGFNILQEYPVYYPDNLWDYINGAADSYLDYKFRDLHIAEYIKGDNSYKAEIYKHESNVYSFGIYALERSSDYHFIELGVQGYEESTLIHFIKGPYYVKVTTNVDEKESATILMKIAKALEKNLDGQISIPEEYMYFPEEGQVSDSEYFVASNFLGYSFLKEAFSVKYEKSGVYFSVFLINANSEKEAGEMQMKLFSKAKKVTEDSPEISVVEDPYNGTIFLGKSGKVLVGTDDMKDLELFKLYFNKITKK